MNETINSSIARICEKAAEEASGFDTAIAILKESWLAFLLLFIVPIAILFIIGSLIEIINKKNFWIIAFSMIIAEIVAIVVFLIIITIW